MTAGGSIHLDHSVCLNSNKTFRKCSIIAQDLDDGLPHLPPPSTHIDDRHDVDRDPGWT
jgi:hypothetical protein